MSVSWAAIEGFDVEIAVILVCGGVKQSYRNALVSVLDDLKNRGWSARC